MSSSGNGPSPAVDGGCPNCARLQARNLVLENQVTSLEGRLADLETAVISAEAMSEMFADCEFEANHWRDRHDTVEKELQALRTCSRQETDDPLHHSATSHYSPSPVSAFSHSSTITWRKHRDLLKETERSALYAVLFRVDTHRKSLATRVAVREGKLSQERLLRFRFQTWLRWLWAMRKRSPQVDFSSLK
jgi:hypothetical protein